MYFIRCRAGAGAFLHGHYVYFTELEILARNVDAGRAGCRPSRRPVGAPDADFSAAFNLPMVWTRLPTKALSDSPSLSPRTEGFALGGGPGGASRRRGIARQRRVDQHELIARSDPRPDRATFGKVVRLAVVVFSLYTANQSDLLFRGLRGGLLGRRLSRCRRWRLRRLSRPLERTRPFPKLQWSQAPRLRILVHSSSFITREERHRQICNDRTEFNRMDRIGQLVGMGFEERTRNLSGSLGRSRQTLPDVERDRNVDRHQPQRSDGVARERNVRITRIDAHVVLNGRVGPDGESQSKPSFAGGNADCIDRTAGTETPRRSERHLQIAWEHG